nr:SDR family NAD(P)-dependent oxidoreductase [Hyphomonas sp. Mor2]
MTVIVTGASGVLGRQACHSLKNAGYDVIGVDLSKERPIELDARVHFIGGYDLSLESDAASCVKEIRSIVSNVKALINIAGGFVWETSLASTNETWERMLRINLFTNLNITRGIVPLLSEGSSIVNIGAAAAAKSDLGMGPYTAAKSAVLRLSEALKEDLKPHGVRVNAISPTIIDTEKNRADMPDANFDEWVQPGEIADLICFLISERSSGINGENIRISGRQ